MTSDVRKPGLTCDECRRQHGGVCPNDDRYWDWGGRKEPLTQEEIDRAHSTVRVLGEAVAARRYKLALEVFTNPDTLAPPGAT